MAMELVVHGRPPPPGLTIPFVGRLFPKWTKVPRSSPKQVKLDESAKSSQIRSEKCFVQ